MKETMNFRETWTSKQAQEALAEGWALFNEGEIQRDDELGVFATDADALDYVKARAAEGSSTHAEAVVHHRRAQFAQKFSELKTRLAATGHSIADASLWTIMTEIVEQCATHQQERSVARHGYDKYNDGDALREAFGLT